MRADSPCIFIVDDDAWVRDSVGVLLDVEGFRTRAYASAEEFLKDYRPTAVGCLLLDVKMPGMSGLELQAALCDRSIELPVIVITAHSNVPTARAALMAGAYEFLEKPVDPVLLLSTLRAALDGDAARRTATRTLDAVENKLKILTARERQVMELVAQGKHCRNVASMLGISPRTVEGHKARVLEKLQVRNVTELVHLVLGNTNELKPGEFKS